VTLDCYHTGAAGLLGMSAAAAAGSWRRRELSQSSSWVSPATRHPARYMYVLTDRLATS